MRKIVWQLADGTLAVNTPILKENETEDEAIARVLRVDVPQGVTVGVMDESVIAALPRRWRESWRLGTGSIGVPLIAARLQRRKELQRLREVVLEKLRDLIEEAEDNDQPLRVAALKARRRAIRTMDLAAKVEAVNDLETLSTYVPTEFTNN